MLTPEDYLRENGFPIASEIDRDNLIRIFVNEMEAGLRKEPSSLLMVNTHIGMNSAIDKTNKAIVLDAGGTNFRAALVSLPTLIEEKVNRPMPGTDKEVGEEEFYQAFVSEVCRLKNKATCEKIGWCFSYPAYASENIDAKLVSWTKGVKAPTIVGQYVGAELLKRLGGGSIAVINDTVATLLAAKAIQGDEEYSSYIGFILGTGTNCAYVEKDLGNVIINAESGAFDKIAQSAFDRAMDAKTAMPGKQIFEKMIAGAYLGPIVLEIWKAAVRQNFFSVNAASKLSGIAALETIDVDNFCGCKRVSGRENPIEAVFTEAGDIRIARRLALPVFERAAVLTAIHLAAFAIKTKEGIDENNPIAIMADGSTWYKTVAIDFARVVKRELDVMLVKKRNIHYKFTEKIESAPMIGAAIVALTK